MAEVETQSTTSKVEKGRFQLQRGPFILSELISRYQTYKKLDGSYENISYLVKSEQP